LALSRKLIKRLFGDFTVLKIVKDDRVEVKPTDILLIPELLGLWGPTVELACSNIAFSSAN